MKVRNENVKTKEERKAAENAKAILARLTPSSARTDRIWVDGTEFRWTREAVAA
jgi:hypothetical protein